MIQLEAIHDPMRPDRGLDRIDWKPHHRHNNRGRGPDHLKFVMQEGSHHHSIALNWHEVDQRLLRSNLPVAAPMSPSIASVPDLFEFAANCFRVRGLEEIPLPPWKEVGS
jgi:hypothetical protein